MELRRFAAVWKAVDDGMSQEDLNKQFGGSKELETYMMVQVKRLRGEL